MSDPSISAERLREILHYDPETGVFTWNISTNNFVKIGSVAGSPDDKGYLLIQIDGRRHKAHRLAWLYETGKWPRDMIDHVNGISSDNRFANLREATRSENMCNKGPPANNRTGLKGVRWRSEHRRWQAQIGVNGQKKHLGYFSTPEEAHAAYAAAAKAFHGDFARVR